MKIENSPSQNHKHHRQGIEIRGPRNFMPLGKTSSAHHFTLNITSIPMTLPHSYYKRDSKPDKKCFMFLAAFASFAKKKEKSVLSFPKNPEPKKCDSRYLKKKRNMFCFVAAFVSQKKSSESFQPKQSPCTCRGGGRCSHGAWQGGGAGDPNLQRRMGGLKKKNMPQLDLTHFFAWNVPSHVLEFWI